MNEHYDYENGGWNSFPEVPFKVKVTEEDEKLTPNEIYTVVEVDEDADGNWALFTLGEETGEESYLAFRFKPAEEEKNEPTLTPAQELGYKVGDKFLERGSDYFNSGTVITLIKDDGSECPFFSDNEGEDWYLQLKDVIPYTTKQEVQDEGWIDWFGGDCPVSGRVSLKFRNGVVTNSLHNAESYYWKHTRHPEDIVAYKVIDSKHPTEPFKADIDEIATLVAINMPEAAVEAPTGFEVNSQGGVKETGGKLRWTLLPIIALKEVVKVLEYGAKKYAPDNWQKVEKEKYKEALWRHWVAYNEGEKIDPETGLHHIAHLVCDALFILWFDLTGKKDA